MTEHKTHFGFQSVNVAEKAGLVKDVFQRVAGRYDVMNDAMSGGLHRLWKDLFVKRANPQPGQHILDMAGGTGDIAFRMLERTRGATPPVAITIADINEDMLAQGQRRADNKGYITGLTWCVADAMHLPFDDQSFELYTIAFGLRNVTDPLQALAEAYRVLKPGGRFLCLEFSKITNPLLRSLYQKYAFHVIPQIGHLLAQDKAAYQYLVESIEQFYDQETLKHHMENAGFSQCLYKNITAGTCAIHEGIKSC